MFSWFSLSNYSLKFLSNSVKCLDNCALLTNVWNIINIINKHTKQDILVTYVLRIYLLKNINFTSSVWKVLKKTFFSKKIKTKHLKLLYLSIFIIFDLNSSSFCLWMIYSDCNTIKILAVKYNGNKIKKKQTQIIN